MHLVDNKLLLKRKDRGDGYDSDEDRTAKRPRKK